MTVSIGRAGHRSALTGLLALAGAAAAYPAAAGPFVAIPISSCPYTIVVAGTYALTQDLTCPATEPAIMVAAGVDNVRLFLKGRTLTGDGTGNVDGIVADGTPEDPIEGLLINGGTVTGFGEGVLVRNAPGARIARVTTNGNLFRGIFVDASPNARIVGNAASDNGLRGIFAQDCDECRILDNRATGNRDGIWLGDTEGAWVKRNTVTGNDDDGIELVFDSTQNLIRANVATDNLGSGISVDGGSAGNRVVRNQATGNDTDDNGDRDLFDANLRNDDCINSWRDNSFATDNDGEGPDGDGPAVGCIQ